MVIYPCGHFIPHVDKKQKKKKKHEPVRTVVLIFTESTLRQIQAISRNVCVFVPLWIFDFFF